MNDYDAEIGQLLETARLEAPLGHDWEDVARRAAARRPARHPRWSLALAAVGIVALVAVVGVLLVVSPGRTPTTSSSSAALQTSNVADHPNFVLALGEGVVTKGLSPSLPAVSGGVPRVGSPQMAARDKVGGRFAVVWDSQREVAKSGTVTVSLANAKPNDSVCLVAEDASDGSSSWLCGPKATVGTGKEGVTVSGKAGTMFVGLEPDSVVSVRRGGREFPVTNNVYIVDNYVAAANRFATVRKSDGSTVDLDMATP